MDELRGGKPRCAWCLGDPLYERYHDEEWGVPHADDVRLFEKLVLGVAESPAKRPALPLAPLVMTGAILARLMTMVLA